MATGTYPNPEIPTRVPLAVTPENRDNTTAKDSKVVNGFMEKGQDGYLAYKRPGLALSSYSVAASHGYGLYTWIGDTYANFGGTLYKNGVSLGTMTTTRINTFDQVLGGTPSLFITCGNKVAYYYNTVAGLTLITFPAGMTNLVRGSAYLDATMYVMDVNANIWGSGLNDLSSWVSSNYIKAQIEPDFGVAIAKHLVYVIALKQWSTEVFYDAGNAVNSPLSPVQGAKINWGCASADTVQEIDGDLLWLSQTRELSYEVIYMKNLKAIPVSTKPVERLLAKAVFSEVYSWTWKGDGHSFYLLTIEDLNLTLAYDIKENLWSQWTDANGNYMAVSDSYGALIQGEDSGKIYSMALSNTDDAGSPITFDLYTPNFDANIDRRKIVKLVRVLADKTPGSVIQIRHNDNDYEPSKWTNFRRLDLNQERPFLVDDGTFNRRAYHIRHQCNTTLRLNAIDLQMDLGTI